MVDEHVVYVFFLKFCIQISSEVMYFFFLFFQFFVCKMKKKKIRYLKKKCSYEHLWWP